MNANSEVFKLAETLFIQSGGAIDPKTCRTRAAKFVAEMKDVPQFSIIEWTDVSVGLPPMICDVNYKCIGTLVSDNYIHRKQSEMVLVNCPHGVFEAILRENPTSGIPEWITVDGQRIDNPDVYMWAPVPASIPPRFYPEEMAPIRAKLPERMAS